MSDNLTDSEMALMSLRTKYREVQDQLESYEAKAHLAADLLKKFKSANESELQNEFIQITETYEEMKLKELRALRENSELVERNNSLLAMIKAKNESVMNLEKEVSKAQVETQKVRNECRNQIR